MSRSGLEGEFKNRGISGFHNSEDRLACVLLIDCSYSMRNNNNIVDVIRGINELKEELMSDSIAANRVEISVITYGGSVQQVHGFENPHDFIAPEIVETVDQIEDVEYIPNGATPMGEAICLALNLLEEQKKQYRAMGVGYYMPWIVNFTDGEPTDEDTSFWSEAVRRTCEGINNNSFIMFNIGTEDANFELIKQLNGRNGEIKTQSNLYDNPFSELLKWIGKSLRTRSQKATNAKVALPAPPQGLLSEVG